MRYVKFTWAQIIKDASYTNTTTMLVEDILQVEDFLAHQEGWLGEYQLIRNEEPVFPILLGTQTIRLTVIHFNEISKIR